jgi:glutamine amidotransferase
MSIGIIDYGIGNLRSIQKGFEYVGATAIISGDVQQLMSCDKLVLPGVGAFSHCKKQLDSSFDDISSLISSRPTLGICIGMQLMFDYSLEFGRTEGLGLIKGYVDKIYTESLPVPHTGWSPLLQKSGNDNPLFSGIPDKSFFYFNHSFSCNPEQLKSVIGTSDYDGNFVCAVAEGNYYGIQCHPEKSGFIGLNLLKNFHIFC